MPVPKTAQNPNLSIDRVTWPVQSLICKRSITHCTVQDLAVELPLTDMFFFFFLLFFKQCVVFKQLSSSSSGRTLFSLKEINLVSGAKIYAQTVQTHKQ